MHVVEVIRLRLATANRDEIIAQISKLAIQLGLDEINIYRHATVDTDLSIHLDHRDVEIDAPFDGRSLSSLLKEFGLVNYSRWVEVSKNKPSDRERG